MSSIAHLQAVQVLVNAQKTAERFVDEAQQYCRELAENARQRRDQLFAEARLSAAKMMERADSEARMAVAEVAARARGGTAAPAFRSEQENLQEEITYLRMYSEVYGPHLRTYLEALLRNVDDWARAEQSPASAKRDQPQA